MARTLPETKATNSYVNPTGGRIYVDIGESTQRKRSAQDIAIELRKRTSQLVGAEYTVLDDLSNGASKPVQIRFSGTDSRKLLAITSDFMTQLRQVPGAVDVGLSQQDPQNELQIELTAVWPTHWASLSLTLPMHCVWHLLALKWATGSTPLVSRAMSPFDWRLKTE